MAVQGSVVSDVACWARSLSLDLQVRVKDIFRDPATQSCVQLISAVRQKSEATPPPKHLQVPAQQCNMTALTTERKGPRF